MSCTLYHLETILIPKFPRHWLNTLLQVYRFKLLSKMEKTIPVFSLKNIPIPSKFAYEKQLIQKGESLISRFRWKVFVSKNPDMFTHEYKTFGFNTLNSPPRDNELNRFEEQFFELISPSNLKYKPVNNQFQNDLKNETRRFQNTDKITVFADKTKNLYHVPVNDYKKKVVDSITQDYEKCNLSKIKNVNSEAASLADNFPVGDDKTLADRIDVLQKNECFITLKDHKTGFPGRVETRLINPSKSNLGKISKQILQRINKNLRIKTGLQQWQSSDQAVSWFQGINNKNKYTFFKLDIVAFYPSISEELLDKSIAFAKTLVPITNEEIKIIKHSRKSFLFHNKESWTKREGKNMISPKVVMMELRLLSLLVSFFSMALKGISKRRTKDCTVMISFPLLLCLVLRLKG